MENKLLILSDTHGRTFWKEAVEKYKDEVDKEEFKHIEREWVRIIKRRGVLVIK